MIGDLEIISKEEVRKIIPSFDNNGDVLYASGGGRVEGERFVNTLLTASKSNVVREKVSLKVVEDKYEINGQVFELLFLRLVRG